MASRTQIVCLHEGARGRSIDPIFIRNPLKALKPGWIRPWEGNNIVRAVDCGGRKTLISRMPGELQACLDSGGHATLMVWADRSKKCKFLLTPLGGKYKKCLSPPLAKNSENTMKSQNRKLENLLAPLSLGVLIASAAHSTAASRF